MLADFEAKDQILQKPALFLGQLPGALDAKRDILYPLFHDNLDKFFSLLEKQLKNVCFSEERTEEEDILLTFAIGGALHTMRTLKFERDCDDEVLMKKLSVILRKINGLQDS